jgi:hypothetical protein
MKKTIFLIAAITATSTLFAQKFELGLNAGADYFRQLYTFPGMEEYHNTTVKMDGGIRPVVSVNALYNVQHWQIGITGSCLNLKFKDSYFVPFGIFGYYLNVNATETLAPVQLRLQRKFTFGKIEAYGGISGGYVLKVANNDPKPDSISGSISHQYGMTAGAQFGATYYVTRKLGVNLEAAGNYTGVALSVNKAYQTNTGLFSFPLTVGIHYKL